VRYILQAQAYGGGRMSEPFDLTHAQHVALYDELPLWSSQAGALLLDHVPLDVRIALDLGCGAGFPLLELAERLGPAAQVIGVDPWAQGLARAAAKRDAWPVPQVALVRGDGTALPFRAAAFELITSNLGVNNFAQPEQALRECRRVLVPGGVLAISTNVAGHFHELYVALEQVLRRRGDTAALARLDRHVQHRGSLEGLAAQLRNAGFEIQATHTRTATWRFRDGRALMAHHFMRLGFQEGWREVAGPAADTVLAELAAQLDANAGGSVVLTVPLLLVLAKVA
jgi:ubiquinone/menaquinone biosynthesis C-methylase UbiE